MGARPKMRRWTDARDRAAWQVLYVPPTAEDPASVRAGREGLVFHGEDGDFQAPAPYGWDLESLTDGDLQGLLDQARTAAQERRRTGGWGVQPDDEERG